MVLRRADRHKARENKAIRSHGRASAGFGCISAYATSHISAHSPPSLGGAKLSRSWYLAQDDWHTQACHTFLPLVSRLWRSERCAWLGFHLREEARMLREGFNSILSLEKPGDPRQGFGALMCRTDWTMCKPLDPTMLLAGRSRRIGCPFTTGQTIKLRSAGWHGTS